MILSGRQQRPTLLMPNWKLDGKRRQIQYALSQNPDFCHVFAQQIIHEKIQNQLNVLQKFPNAGTYIHIIRQIQQQIPFSFNLSQLRGLEGAASAQYFNAWQAVLPEDYLFTGRNRRPPKDPINSLLSLGYTLLHFEIVKHIQLCGLDPFIGFFHVAEHGRESLACDLIEPLRPLYDEWLLNQFAENIFSQQDFNQSDKGCTLNKPARLRFYQQYEKLAKSWRAHIHQLCYKVLAQLKCGNGTDRSDGLIIIENPNDPEESVA